MDSSLVEDPGTQRFRKGEELSKGRFATSAERSVDEDVWHAALIHSLACCQRNENLLA
jgi:hypothetical protein